MTFVPHNAGHSTDLAVANDVAATTASGKLYKKGLSTGLSVRVSAVRQSTYSEFIIQKARNVTGVPHKK